MSPTPSVVAPSRLTLAVLFGVLLAWQVYVVLAAIHHGLVLSALLSSLGTTLPAITRAYLATLMYWPGVPLVSVLLAADVLRRPTPPIKYSGFALLFVAGAGFTLQAWASEAWFAPILELMRKLG